MDILCACTPYSPTESCSCTPSGSSVTKHGHRPFYAGASARISFLARSHTLTLTCLQLLTAPDPCISNMTGLAWTGSEPTLPAAYSGAAWRGPRRCPCTCASPCPSAAASPASGAAPRSAPPPAAPSACPPLPAGGWCFSSGPVPLVLSCADAPCCLLCGLLAAGPIACVPRPAGDCCVRSQISRSAQRSCCLPCHCKPGQGPLACSYVLFMCGGTQTCTAESR